MVLLEEVNTNNDIELSSYKFDFNSLVISSIINKVLPSLPSSPNLSTISGKSFKLL